jgi:hypothetical protein
LEDVKEDVDALIERRNIQNLSISGGEPLLYPDLDALIAYAGDKGLSVMLITNGLELTTQTIRKYRDLGVVRIVIHIDSLQNREGYSSEADLNALRAHYCDLFRNCPGISLGFIMTLSRENAKELDVLIPFFKQHADVIHVVTFTLLQDPLAASGGNGSERAAARDMIDGIQSLYGCRYCAYLKKTRSEDAAWLFASNIFLGSTLLGSIDKELCRIVQEDHLRKRNKYLYVANRPLLSWRLLFFLLFRNSMAPILLRHPVRALTGRLHQQLILIINTPTRYNGSWDICDGCPDAILHNGKLKPSCLLDAVNGDMEV